LTHDPLKELTDLCQLRHQSQTSSFLAEASRVQSAGVIRRIVQVVGAAEKTSTWPQSALCIKPFRWASDILPSASLQKPVFSSLLPGLGTSSLLHPVFH